jgi:predicted unusual protein kinase regulating ubiquinone biosynthesis (AarF/ABC1/UbiB family)
MTGQNRKDVSAGKVDRERYRKVHRFFSRVFLHILWWDILLTLPVLRFFRTPAVPRWKKIAQQFRELAVSMGGVLIKLGQFLSVRIDLLPAEIVDELAGLRDEVPPVAFEYIKEQLEDEFHCSIDTLFLNISIKPLGSASLAQAHEVLLRSGQPAVVKVLRPGIHRLVETDLAIISKAFRWLKLYRKVRDKVDLDWLTEEFTAVTRRELDLEAEGHHAERLAKDFINDPFVLIPKIYWQYCNARTLTLEKVDFIKVDDREGLKNAGIRCEEVAERLYQIYMQQVFETYFVHADPHPGNLFVKPLPGPEEKEAGIKEFHPGETVPFTQGRPFQLVFIDFGMMVTIPDRLRSSLRKYAVGVGTRDAAKIVQAYVEAGALPATADLRRIEKAHQDLFRRLWGVRVGQFKNLVMKEAKYFIRQYRDVIYEAPFQFQADMLFVVRAVGMLAGLATFLDPHFDPWEKTIPYAERFAKVDFWDDLQNLPREFQVLVQTARNLPGQLDRLLYQALEGRISINAQITEEKVNALQNSLRRLGWTIMASSAAISGTVFHTVGSQEYCFGSYLLATLFFVKAIKRN